MSESITTTAATMSLEIKRMEKLLTAIGTTSVAIIDCNGIIECNAVLNDFIQVASDCISEVDDSYLTQITEVSGVSVDELQYSHKLATVLAQFNDRFNSPMLYILNNVELDTEDFQTMVDMSNEITLLGEAILVIDKNLLNLTSKIREILEDPSVTEDKMIIYHFYMGVINGLILKSGFLDIYGKLSIIAQKHLALAEAKFDVEQFNIEAKQDEEHFSEEGKTILSLDEFNPIPHAPDSPYHPDNIPKSELDAMVTLSPEDIKRLKSVTFDGSDGIPTNELAVYTSSRGTSKVYASIDEAVEQSDTNPQPDYPIMTDEEHEEMCEDFLKILDHTKNE